MKPIGSGIFSEHVSLGAGGGGEGFALPEFVPYSFVCKQGCRNSAQSVKWVQPEIESNIESDLINYDATFHSAVPGKSSESRTKTEAQRLP